MIGWIAERDPHEPRLTRAFAAAGRMTLTLYVLHALVFNVVVIRWHLIRPTGLDVALVFAGGFWLVGDRARRVVAAAFRDRPGRVVLPKVRRQQPAVPHWHVPNYNTSLKVSHCFGSPEL